MIKKLFLFTLLVSSFLVISWSNKDTTGATSSSGGIDSKYAHKYSGNVTHKYNGSSTLVAASLTVNNDGSAVLDYAAYGVLDSINFKKEEISFSENKYGYDVYTGMRDGLNSRSFILGFNSTSANIMIYTDGGALISGDLNK